MMLSKEKLSNRGRGKRALAYILLIAVCVIIIYPLLWTIGASFNPGNSLVSTSIIPKNPTNEHYVKLFAGEGNLFYKQWYLNSLKISVFTMLLSLISVSFTVLNCIKITIVNINAIAPIEIIITFLPFFICNIITSIL